MLDDGTLEMECDELWRASADFVAKLIEGKWRKINWHDDVLRAIDLERCKSAAPASVANPDHQWFCSKAEPVVTYADRALAILGYNRNGEFHSAASAVLRVANTTPASSTAKVECKALAVRQITEVMSAASARYRAFFGASSCLPFPAFTDAADKATVVQMQAKAARHLVTNIGVVMPSMLHSAAAAAADDDDDNGGGGGKLSKSNKKKAAQALADAQQANRDAKRLKSQGGGVGGGGGDGDGGGSRSGGGSGGGGGFNKPGDLADRAKIAGDSVTFHWPKGPGSQGRPATDRTFKAAAVEKSSPLLALAPPKSACRSSSCTRCRRTTGTTTSVRPPLLPQPASCAPQLRHVHRARAGSRARPKPAAPTRELTTVSADGCGK